MNKKYLIIILLIITAAAVAIWFSWRGHHPKDEILLYGNVDVRQVDISFRVAGRVVSMSYQEGDQVEQGTLLGELEEQPYGDQVLKAVAYLEAAVYNWENAQQQADRRKELVKSGGVSKENLDNTSANEKILKANLNQAKADLAIAQKNYADTKVYAPVKGTILSRIREPGTVLREGDPIYTVTIKDPTWIRAYVSEPELGLIHPGMEAQVFTDTPDAPTYRGKIGFISPVAEFTPKTVETTDLRTNLVYRIRVYVDNPDWGLRQGMPVTVTIPLVNRNE